MVLKYLLLFIIVEHYSILISGGKISICLFFLLIISFVNIDFNIEHAALSVHPERWKWWDYSVGVGGPDLWGLYFQHCEGGRFQSPINIESRHLIFDYQLTPIYINNSDNVCFLFLFKEAKKKNLFVGAWNTS